MRDAKPAEILYLHVYSSVHVMFDTIVQSDKCFVNPIIRLDILIGNLIEDNRPLSHLLF
jgi:hypothetical protein